MIVKLYSTGCPRCNVLEKKLTQAGIGFELIKNFSIDEMREKGFMSAPILQVDDDFMDFSKANAWLKTYTEG